MPSIPNRTEAASPSALTPETTSSVNSRKRPALPGYATYLPDWNQTRLLEDIMCSGVDPGTSRNSAATCTYDGFEVVGAWKIVNETRKVKYELALQRERQKVEAAVGDDSSARLPIHLPEDMNRLISELGQDRLDQTAGEVFLLQGTAPTNLHSILFQGLDHEVVRDGKFGRGVYFAENVCGLLPVSHQLLLEITVSIRC